MRLSHLHHNLWLLRVLYFYFSFIVSVSSLNLDFETLLGTFQAGAAVKLFQSIEKESGDSQFFHPATHHSDAEHEYIYTVMLDDNTPDIALDTIKTLLHALNSTHKFSITSVFKGFIFEFPEKLPVEQLQRIPFVRKIVQSDQMTLQDVQQPAPTWALDILDQSSNRFDGKYKFSLTGQGVHIFVVDSGIFTLHQEFQGRADNFFTVDKEYTDCQTHGTHVASLVGGVNVGIAKRAQIHSVRVVGCQSTVTTSVANVLQAIESVVKWVIQNKKPSVINLSLSMTANANGSPNPELDRAVAGAIQAGITVVVASGNDATNACSQSPLSVAGVIVVGAYSSNLKRWPQSNFGECVAIWAPGDGVVGAFPDGKYTTKTGTSQATPFVSGVVAMYLEKNPNATPADVLKAIQFNGVDKLISDARGSVSTGVKAIDVPNSSSNDRLVNFSTLPSVPNDGHPVYADKSDLPLTVIICSSVFGGIALLLLIGGVGFFFYRRRKRRRLNRDTKSNTTSNTLQSDFSTVKVAPNIGSPTPAAGLSSPVAAFSSPTKNKSHL